MSIRATNIGSFRSDVAVYLTDKESGTKVNLREMPEYLFMTGNVSDLNRFELSFGNQAQVPTDIDDNETETVRITAYSSNNKGIVTVKDDSFKGDVNIEVFDLLGKRYTSTNSVNSRTEVDLPANTQMVILRVSYQNQVKTFKLVSDL